MLQDPEAGRLQAEVAQLTDTVVQQRQFITELRSQLRRNGSQMLPEQVQILEAAQSSTADAVSTRVVPSCPAHPCAHLHLQMANGAPGGPTAIAQTTMVIEELVDGPETIVLEIFQHTTVAHDTAAPHATQPVVR